MNPKKYCPYCAAELVNKFLQGKNRLFCPRCKKPIYENPIPATAAVVVNDKGKVLLVKRKVEPRKGEWCLPGGFVELEETPEKGCLRELEEETGIKADIDRLVGVFPSKSPIYNSVLVIGYSTRNPRGRIRPGDDSEDAAFFKVDKVPQLAFRSHQAILEKVLRMKEKERPGVFSRLRNYGNLGAYVITSQNHIELAQQACRARPRILQYRDKTSSRKEMLGIAQRIRQITFESNTLFIVNDYIDVALLAEADGVHLGQDDIPIHEARKITPPGFIIGRSTHSFQQAVEAEKQGADYIGSGPVFATPTKETYIPIGIDCVKEVQKTVKIPVVAIGGLTLDNIAQLYDVGVRNFAMVRAFQEDSEEVVNRINTMVFGKISQA